MTRVQFLARLSVAAHNPATSLTKGRLERFSEAAGRNVMNAAQVLKRLIQRPNCPNLGENCPRLGFSYIGILLGVRWVLA